MAEELGKKPGGGDVTASIGAGLDLSERWADWSKTPFTASSRSHVSVWRKPPADSVSG
ncbi:hypothetical protein [Streptomyces sp. NPDC058330]|uniref:hypothetical protein n=1 Tax=Streptomyces sp. NPDC058330 TaxID=3346449 RepID=UPI0036E26917